MLQGGYKQKYYKYKSKYMISKMRMMGGECQREFECTLYENKQLNLENWVSIEKMITEAYNDLINTKTGTLIEALKENKILEKIITLIKKISGSLYEGTGEAQWVLYDCATIESKSEGNIYITLDAHYAQIMFFTNIGFLRMTIYPKVILHSKDDHIPVTEKIYFKLTKELVSPKLETTAKLLDMTELDKKKLVAAYEYLANYKNGPDDENSMRSVLNFMYKEYASKARPFIAMLGKARFLINQEKASISDMKPLEGNMQGKIFVTLSDVNQTPLRTYHDTYELFSNLLFRNCNLGFMTGGYKGVDFPGYGVTRSGYELAKHFEKPSVVIMCNAGVADSHEHTDALGLYGMHWGDDTEVLSLMADAGIFIAPFGAWTYIEIALLSHRQKPIVIYFDSDLFILNSSNWEKLGYGKSDHPNIQKLLASKDNDDGFAKYKITKNSFWGSWYVHYDTKKEHGIPIVRDYAAAATYILANLESPCAYTTKAHLLAKALGIHNETPIKLTLNRSLEYKLNDFTGTYEKVNINRSNLTEMVNNTNYCNSSNGHNKISCLKDYKKLNKNY